MSKQVMIVFGTRPECIKLAPVIAALKARPKSFTVTVCASGQHHEMLDQAIRVLGVVIDRDLQIMRPAQSLPELTAGLIGGIAGAIDDFRPDWVMVQGDTTTAFAAALAAYYAGRRIAHVEAGLRTGDLRNPYPEEANRRMIATLADLHFAPTARAADALQREGVPQAAIHITGNTIVDALHAVLADFDIARVDGRLRELVGAGKAPILVTCHRRESFGDDLAIICRAIRRIAAGDRGRPIIFPVHLNPNVRAQVLPLLGNKANIHLLEPLDYRDFIFLLSKSALVLTDSGGVQEEAPSLGIPVLVFRRKTERLESLDAGLAKLVGINEELIATSVLQHLAGAAAGNGSFGSNPYGDGKAAQRIAEILTCAS